MAELVEAITRTAGSDRFLIALLGTSAVTAFVTGTASYYVARLNRPKMLSDAESQYRKDLEYRIKSLEERDKIMQDRNIELTRLVTSLLLENGKLKLRINQLEIKLGIGVTEWPDYVIEAEEKSKN
jgi:hypothetical protein